MLGVRVPFLSRPAYRLQLWSSALDAVFTAALLKASFLAAGDLHAPRWAVMVGAAVTAFPMVLAPVFAERVGRWNRRKLFWWCALIGRGTFVAAALIGHWVPFILLAILPWFVVPVVLPAIHQYWQANYPTSVRGRLWGRVELMRGLLMVVCYQAYGLGLEYSPEMRRVIFPFAGICGCASLVLIGYIRVRRRRSAPPAPPGAAYRGLRRLFNPWRGAIELLQQNRRFLWYEVGFMLYGFGFMLCNFLRDDHLARDAKLDHLEFAWYLMLFQLAMPAASPLYGWLFDRARAAWTSAAACAFLVPYAYLLYIGTSVPVIWSSAVAMGFGMAGVHVCWNLGVVEFAGERDSSPYTAVHAACVGIRAAVALPVAWYIQHAYREDARPVFLTAAAFFACAIASHFWLGLHQRGREPAPTGPPAEAKAAA